MNGRTHILIAATTALTAAQATHANPRTHALTLTAALATARLPDTDHHHKHGKRRSPTHSLLALAAITTLAGLTRSTPITAGALIGYATHLLADAATPQGIPLLWPITRRHTHLGTGQLVKLTKRTNTLIEGAILAALTTTATIITATARTAWRWRLELALTTLTLLVIAALFALTGSPILQLAVLNLTAIELWVAWPRLRPALYKQRLRRQWAKATKDMPPLPIKDMRLIHGREDKRSMAGDQLTVKLPEAWTHEDLRNHSSLLCHRLDADDVRVERLDEGRRGRVRVLVVRYDPHPRKLKTPRVPRRDGARASPTQATRDRNR